MVSGYDVFFHHIYQKYEHVVFSNVPHFIHSRIDHFNCIQLKMTKINNQKSTISLKVMLASTINESEFLNVKK